MELGRVYFGHVCLHERVGADKLFLFLVETDKTFSEEINVTWVPKLKAINVKLRNSIRPLFTYLSGSNSVSGKDVSMSGTKGERVRDQRKTTVYI